MPSTTFRPTAIRSIGFRFLVFGAFYWPREPGKAQSLLISPGSTLCAQASLPRTLTELPGKEKRD